MMNTRLFSTSTKSFISETGISLTVRYGLIIEEIVLSQDGISIENYGVCVDILESGERAYIKGITVLASTILNLLDLLSEMLVTPSTLVEVLDDLLGEI